jgi:hypothetical protein
MAKLASLDLSETPIGDAGVAHLREMLSLEHIDLWSTNITGAALESLSALKNLKRLSLENTRITDAGLPHLEPLVALEYLNLTKTGISGEGLKQLYGLTNLKELVLGFVDTTDEQIAAFQQAVPGCRITRTAR